MVQRPFVVAGALATAVLAGCDRVPLLCRDEGVAGVASPDGKRIADLFVRDCHMTTGYTVHLTLREAGSTRRGRTVGVFSGARQPTIVWNGPRRLVVSPDARSSVLYQTPKWNDVAIEFAAPSGSKSGGTQ